MAADVMKQKSAERSMHSQSERCASSSDSASEAYTGMKLEVPPPFLPLTWNWNPMHHILSTPFFDP